MKVTIKYGINTVVRDYAFGTVVAAVAEDENLKAVLGFGDNVRFLTNGVELPLDAALSDGTVITVETACNQKAS